MQKKDQEKEELKTTLILQCLYSEMDLHECLYEEYDSD